ncbi:broad-complex core protein isoforms 1/2/3/4/5 [Folsomia candida]|uniref:broad-complex core protein isoforms 1/2/3/4/5 n=1 Tax=Folsomia candida TaxID=158441 RepID=UPI000B90584B|nr:broad-complex core protein isoforms 1/2/3/4/5 [Folsomia candida]XP_035709760.1 broad-complex core protein isoforms 1/2/3/4/5 [Folsomia candida]
MASSPSDVEIVAPPPPLVLREEEPLPSSLDKHHHNLMISPGREGSKIDEPVTTTSMSSSSSMSLDDNMLQVTSFPGREGGEDNISVDLTQVRTHPGDNLVDSSTRRKRNFHRRKSDPVTLKKIPKIEPQSDPESRHGTQISDFNSNKIGRADGFVPFLMDDEEDDDDDEIVKDDDFTRRRRLLSMSTTTSGRTRSRKSSTCRQKLQKISPPPPVKERDPEMYHFHWKNHLPHILSSFESLLGQETFCDVTLICDDNDHDDLIVPLKAHRIVLSACSEYFGRMLAEHPCKHPVIVLKDYAAWEVRALLEFMYRGEVVIGLDRVDALMKSAKSLEIRGLTEALLENAFRTNLPKHPNKQVNSNNTPAELSNHKLLLVPDSLPSTALNLSHHPHHTLSRRHNLRHNHLVEEEGDLLRHHNNFTSGPELESSFGESSPPTSDDATPLLDLIDLNNSKNQAHFHHNSLIMPRRKQARPRRRSGDFIAQDLRKVVPNEVVGGKLMRNEINNDEKLYDEEEDDDSLCGGRGSFDEDSFEENFSSGRGQNRLLSEKFGSTGGEMSFSGERDVDDEEEMEELLPPRGKSSSPSPRHDGDDDEKDEDRLEEEDNMGDDDQGIIDYTMPPIAIVGGGGNGNKATRGGMNEHVEPGVTSGWNDSLQHRHLAFLRNYNLAMAQSGKLAKLSEPDMDEQHHPHHHHHIHNHPHRRGSSSSPSPTKPPHPFLPRPDQLLSSFPFLLPGLLPHNHHNNAPHPQTRQLPLPFLLQEMVDPQPEVLNTTIEPTIRHPPRPHRSHFLLLPQETASSHPPAPCRSHH